jgi:Domain of unknown function (DUF4214)
MLFTGIKVKTWPFAWFQIFIIAALILGSWPVFAQETGVGVAGCNDQNVGNLADPGYPATSTLVDMYNDDPDFLKYDHVNFDVFQRQMHNRLVTVAVHKNHELAYADRVVFSEFVFNTWAIFWKEYGGFPFPSYTFLIGHNLPYGEISAYGQGNATPHTRTDWTAHEMYHAWNGCAFRQENQRTWLMEGVTMYMGSMRQQKEYTFESIMRSCYYEYDQFYTSGQDRPIGDMGYNQDGYLLNGDHHFVAIKGLLITYLLDKELSLTGRHIGEVMRLIYQRYGAEYKGSISNQQILSIFNEVSGVDFTDFFNRYIYGAEKLPLDGKTFEWICHNDRRSIDAFVTRFYQQCLGREPDMGGLNSWSSNLLNGTLSGADVANGFIFSQEFTNRHTTNEDFVTILYRAFFNREPDDPGYASWLNSLYGGTDRATVLDGFIKSQEFSDLCNNYGISPY